MGLSIQKSPEHAAKEGEPRWYVPKRYIVTVLGFLGVVCSQSMRVNITVALVAMTNRTTPHHKNDSYSESECEATTFNGSVDSHELHESQITGEKFNWSPHDQGLVLSSFFYGYFMTVMLGGVLAQTFSASRIFGGGILMASLLSLLTPTVAHLGLVPLIALRVLTGIFEGVAYPSINAIIGNWAPEYERTRIFSIIFSGISIGTVFSKAVSGFLCGWDAVGGWPSVFYFFGTVGCVWFSVWAIFIYDSPEKHSSISVQELSLIKANAGDTFKKLPAVPWRKIFTTKAMWGVLIPDAASYLTMTAMVMQLPSYFSNVLHFRIEAVGLLVGLPQFLESFGTILSSVVADKMIASGKLSTTAVRKIFNSICFFGSAACLLGIPWSGCESVWVVACFCTFMLLISAKHSGCGVTHIDMCPRLASVLYGIFTSISCVCGMIGPMMASACISSGMTLRNWSKVFYIIAGVNIFGGIVFCLLAQAELQPWVENEDVKQPSEKEKSCDDYSTTEQYKSKPDF